MNCKHCLKSFEPKTNHKQLYCSKPCSSASWRTSNSLTAQYNLDKSTVGAINELKASVFLMEKGYEVFRALSPATSCDLIAMKSDEVLRIEVRTGYSTPTGIRTRRYHQADHLLIVTPSGISLEPPLESI